MNRGRGTQPTFVDGADNQAFLDTLAEAHRLWSLEVFAYAMRGNHYHLCLRTPKGNLSRVMRHLMACIPSDLTDTIVVTGPCFRDATRQSLSMPMNI
jgi:putative transposase